MRLHGASRDSGYTRTALLSGVLIVRMVVTVCWGPYPGPISTADCLSNTIRLNGAETVRLRGNRRRSLGTVGLGMESV